MPEINTRFLFTLALEIQVSSLGDTPYGRRRMFHFDGGSFDGPKLKGKVLPGGGGWSLIRRDDVMEVDARLILETNDNHQIYAAWKGLRHGPKEVMDRLYQGEIVDPGAYYFRTTPYFETSSDAKDPEPTFHMAPSPLIETCYPASRAQPAGGMD